MTAADDSAAPATSVRTCPLCEAGCGLELTVEAGRVTRIRGDRDDVFSRGFLCPKGTTLHRLHEDPDRVRTPLVRRDGQLREATWDEAWRAIADGIERVVAAHGRSALGAYVGNPTAHNLGALLFARHVLRALGSPNVFSASTVDQRPKELSAGLMFGGAVTIPVPDVDRTDHLLIVGANPMESNGSLATAPDWPGRLGAIRARGGRVVVIDPRRTKTAQVADEHVPIRPGADPLLLAAMLHVLFVENLVDLGDVAPFVKGLDDLDAAVRPFAPEAVADRCGIPVVTIRRLATELAAARSGAVYARMGTTVAAFGTVTSWLVDALNTCTGNLDRAGGAMFTRAAAGAANVRGHGRFGNGVRLGRRRTRVRGLPVTLGELPVAALAEEIETAGDGQIRAMVTVAGNPVLSAPDSARMDAAFASLDLVVCVDAYVNETTRHADVVLPVPSPLQREHYDLSLLQLAVRNVANYSPPTLPLGPGERQEWEVLATLAQILDGVPPGEADPAVVDDAAIRKLVDAAVADEHGPLHSRDPDDLLDELGERRGPARLLDLMLRTGPYELSLDDLLAQPHGIDLGPLEPRIPEALRQPDGMIDLAPDLLVHDVATRLVPLLERDPDRGLVLIGRRDLRSNNSWMHNLDVLVRGRPRCTLLVHPSDAATRGLIDGGDAEVCSEAGSLVATVAIDDAVMPGVVSLPHGWGHSLAGVRLSVAERHAGVNANLLTRSDLVDPLSGTAVFNGVPVVVGPAVPPHPRSTS